jgi:PAS domain S-box-containing protein
MRAVRHVTSVADIAAVWESSGGKDIGATWKTHMQRDQHRRDGRAVTPRLRGPALAVLSVAALVTVVLIGITLRDESGAQDSARRADSLQGVEAASAAGVESSLLWRDARNATVAAAVADGAALVLLGVLLWRSTLCPVLRLARSAASLAAGERVTIRPTGRRDEVGALTDALALWQRTNDERDLVFRLSPDAQVVCNFHGYMTDVNASMEALTGYSREELLTRPLLEWIHPDDRELTAQSVDQVVEGGRVAPEVRLLCRDGVARLVSWSGVRSPTRELMYGIGRDVSETRRALEVLEEQAHLLDLAHDAILVRAVESAAITYWSRGAEETYGWSAAEALGRTAHELLHASYPRPRSEIESEVLSTGSWSGELTHHRRDGSRVVVHSRWALRTDAAGTPTGMLEVNRDISERFNGEEALRQAADAASSANRAKSEFLSRMSHELRTPLNAVLGFAGLLELELEGKQCELVQTIGAAGRHLLDLIDDVLDISRIEGGVMTLSLEPVSIDAVVREAAELVAPLAAARGITMRTEPHTLVEDRVVADPQRLKQVLLNLLSNAVKYNRDGGRVSIRLETDGRHLRLGVSDTGPGIPEEMLGRLFRPFDRLGAERLEVEGSGLGLAISHGLVSAMEGSLWADSGPEGTTFWVQLSLVQETVTDLIGNDSRQFEVVSPSLGTTEKHTVLYVEDNLSNLRLIRYIVELRPGIDLVPAMQGRLALELALAHRVSLVLLDLHLPDISGEEVLDHLRADERTRHIPVVVVSADATPPQIDRLLRAGAYRYLTKPLDVREFLAVLDDVLSVSPRVPGSIPEARS